MTNIAMENPLEMEVLMGKSSINWQFSMAMLNNQRVTSVTVIAVTVVIQIKLKLNAPHSP